MLIPDTVIYKYCIPAYWYFTGADGRLKRKNKASIVSKKIYAEFVRGAKHHDDIVACHISEGQRASSDADSSAQETRIRYFDARSLHNFLFLEEKPDDGCLQKFVRPKGLNNLMIQAAWSPQMCLLERRVNFYPMLSGRVPLQERCATYEGDEHLSKLMPVRGTLLPEKIQQLCWEMVSHIRSISQQQICRMLMFFKPDNEVCLVTHGSNTPFLKYDQPLSILVPKSSESESVLSISEYLSEGVA